MTESEILSFYLQPPCQPSWQTLILKAKPNANPQLHPFLGDEEANPPDGALHEIPA
jgi:hypothetical protein